MQTTLSQGYRYPYAYVAFGGNCTRWWMRFLKRGFYHCALVLGNGRDWILIDPLVHFTDLIVLKNVSIPKALKAKGYRLVRTTPHIPDLTSVQFRPLTCVEVVKRFLGINQPQIWTPYQLFKFLFLKKENNP
ncbi:MAG: hypothetical protein SPL08_05490 [Pseudomonadota bacterium]|nr:hypothetical protein [Pseudomonadota bacterium]